MKTKFFFVLSIACFLFVNCSKTVSLEPEDAVVTLNGRSSSISAKEAEQLVLACWDKVYGNNVVTKTGKSGPAIKSIEACYLPLTKASESSSPLAYVVNFQDSTGFSVVFARKGAPSILAITERGSLSSERLSFELNKMENAMDDVIEDNTSQKEEDVVYSLLAHEILCRNSYINTYTVQEDTTHTYQVLSQVRPLIPVKWGQDYPFNQNMPVMNNLTSNPLRGRAPVGCVVIAAAQMMYINGHPALQYIAPDNTISWSMFGWVCPYNDITRFLPDYYDTGTTSAEKTLMSKLTEVFPVIAEDCDATYVLDETSISLSDALIALQSYDSAYYGNAVIVPLSFYMFELIGMLDYGKPTIIRGAPNDMPGQGGHAWVADGYLEVQESTGYGSFSQYLLHFNWGLYGENDGYYALGAYSYNGRLFYDAVYDPSIPDQSNDFNYSWSVQYIKY